MSKLSPSQVALLLANIFILAGVMYFNWSFGDILLLFWVESLIVGLSTVIKMLIASPTASIFFIPFFAIHFGIFMTVHFMFLTGVLNLLDGRSMAALTTYSLSSTSPLLRIVRLGPAIATLLASHAFSLFTNYIGKIKKDDISKLMVQPYLRIFPMHLTLLFGMFLSAIMSPNSAFLALFIVLKTIADFKSHSLEHGLKS